MLRKRKLGVMLATVSVLGVSSLVATANVPVSATATVPIVKKLVKKALWNLQNADIHAVIQTISQMTGKDFIVDPRVQGRVTVISTKPMSNDEIYQVFLSMLSVLGYAAIPGAHNVVKIVPAMIAKEYGAQLASEKHPGVGDQVVARVVPVNNISATQLVPILRPLMQEWGSVTAYTPSNTLIFAGTASNIARLVKMVHKMDASNATSIQMVTLKHANAEKIAAIIEQIQSKNKAEGKVSNVSVVADPESNALLVSGNSVNRAQMLSLVKSLDKASATNNANTVVIHLSYLTASDVAPILMKVAHGDLQRAKAGKSDANSTSSLGDSAVSIQAEKNDNALVISAPAQMLKALRAVVKKLDVPPEQVLVEAVIVRVSEQVADQLGITWGTRLPSTAAAALGATGAAGFQEGMGFLPGGDIGTLITALSKNTSADILSTPSILVLNNQPATISNGETVSMFNRSYAASDPNSGSGSTVPFNTLSRNNVALTLKVTPQISPNNVVRLKIAQQDNALANPSNPGTSPVESTSSIKTTVMVHSGDVLVLGGLLKNDHSGGYSSVPILGDIPLLGNLFRYKNKTEQKENLMIFIKPVILGGKASGNMLTSARYHYMRYQELQRREGLSVHGASQGPLLPQLKGAGKHALHLPSPFQSHDD